MSTKTVRLDEETEEALKQIRKQTGLSISEALKKGILVLRDEVTKENQPNHYEIYRELDLGEGGYAIAPSTQTREGVKKAIKEKLKR